MPKLAVLGDKTSVLGFRSLGMDTYTIERSEEAEKAWQSAKEQEYAVIFVTETVYKMIKNRVLEITEDLTPAILVIPGATGPQGLGTERMRKIIETAVGIDIMSSREGEEGE